MELSSNVSPFNLEEGDELFIFIVPLWLPVFIQMSKSPRYAVFLLSLYCEV
jgi:hypothetical protein